MDDPEEFGMSRRHIYIIFSIIQVCCWLGMVWPGPVFANHIEPFVMGLPFLVFWYVLWVFIMLVDLIVLYWVESLEEVDNA